MYIFLVRKINRHISIYVHKHFNNNKYLFVYYCYYTDTQLKNNKHNNNKHNNITFEQ